MGMEYVLRVARSKSSGWVTRRDAIKATGLGVLAAALAGCGGGATRGSPSTGDLSARFAAYPLAPEPNGDLSKVVWPDFVTQAGPEVKRLYEFQVLNGDLMRYMPCFCGCWRDGHQSNRDCYVKDVNADGSVVFDPMAPT